MLGSCAQRGGAPGCRWPSLFERAYAHDLVPALATDAVISHLPEESALLIERMRRNGYHVLSTAEWLEELTQSHKEHQEE